MTVEGAIRLGGSPGQAAPQPAGPGGDSPPLPAGRPVGTGRPRAFGGNGDRVEVRSEPAPGPAMVSASASFSVDEGTGLVMIKLINSTTGEVIRRIPPRDYVQLILESGSPTQGTLFEARS